MEPEREEPGQVGELIRDGATYVVVGEVEPEEPPERGNLRWDFAGEVVPGEVEEFEVRAAGQRQDGAVQPVVVEVEEAELVERGEVVERATEVERREREAEDSASRGAADAGPRGGAGVRAGPIENEASVGVGLEAEARERVRVIAGGRSGESEVG